MSGRLVDRWGGELLAEAPTLLEAVTAVFGERAYFDQAVDMPVGYGQVLEPVDAGRCCDQIIMATVRWEVAR